LSDECQPLISSTSDAGLGAQHPPFLTEPKLVSPSTGDEKNTLRTEITPIACWRMDDLRFEFDSSLVLVDAADEFLQLAILRRVHPGAPFCMFGHADPVGNDEYNKRLSGRRVRSVYAVLTRNISIWEDLYSHPAGGDDWKKGGALKVLLGAIGQDPETAEDYRSDPAKRATLFSTYMDLICRDESGKPYQVNKSEFLAQGADPDGKGDYQGCGEFNPVLICSREENAEFDRQQDKTERDEANAPNRRVVVFLFRPGSRVDPKKWPCQPAKAGPENCHKRFWKDGDKRRKNQEERREFKKTKDTFACRFYHRLAAGSPCESGVERSTPLVYFPEEPGSSNWVLAHSLNCYVIYFRGGGPTLESVQLCFLKEGRLLDADTRKPFAVHCNRQVWFYFSHRPDLWRRDKDKLFKADRSGLPLVGPICVPCGPEARIKVDIWKQNDWAIVRANPVDGEKLDKVLICDWKDDYQTGRLLPMKSGSMGFFPYGHYSWKQAQESWDGLNPYDLVQLSNPGKIPMWVGTLSAPTAPKAKLLLVHNAGGAGPIYVATYNELQPIGKNQDLPGYHQYKASLVSKLVAVSAKHITEAQVDALPDPPARYILPGDMCFQDQGQTNHCGAYSFSTAMNYWMPYTNNPGEKNGAFYSNTANVPSVVLGARSPANIEAAAVQFQMNGRDNAGEGLDRARALKLVKLWLQAGVPVLMLVKENYNIWSYHWKTLAGYDGNRFFINNSGADYEVVRENRTPGVEYEHAPVGNDVDSEQALYTKWLYAGGDIVDIIIAPSVDRCTFIPIYPQDPMFAGDKGR
jgi:outer membrane protein OmpA-like peptidoglycan-associated protein